MRISRRTSGGRGEYEISEEAPGGIQPHDLLGRRLILELSGDWLINTGIVLRRQGGKLRLRRLQPHPDQMQVARQLAAALLLPEPVRADEALGVGAPVVQSNRYAVEHIMIDRVTFPAVDTAALRVGTLIVRNGTVNADEIDLRQRISLIRSIWQAAREFPESIARRLDAHYDAVHSSAPITTNTELLVRGLQENVSEMSGDLNIIYSHQTDILYGLQNSLMLQISEPALKVDDVDPEEVDVRLRTTKEWKRWANARGPKSAVFRERVRRAYRATCVVCGKRYPPTPISAPGVDAAHILPWSEYDLDQIFNGLCLCKLHHWAFDEALIMIKHMDNRYGVVVPNGTEAKLLKADMGFSIDVLHKDSGEIPVSRLPANEQDWPRPQLLYILNSLAPDIQ